MIFCSSCILMLPGICWIYFSNSFFVSPRDPITTGFCCGFHPPIRSISISRYLYFDNFSITLIEVFFLVGMDMSMSRQLFSCLFLIPMSGLFAFIPRCLYWHIPKDCDVVIFCYCLGLILVPFLFCVYIQLFANVPV